MFSCMKNITLSAPESALKAGREIARQRHTTLNQMFRDWLQSLAGPANKGASYEAMMAGMDLRVRVGGRHYTREKMNER
jgi:hypothetical protein